MPQNVEAIRWEGNVLYLLDQRLLPASTDYLRLADARVTAEAITSMVVRGAPAIGITAAYGVVLSVLEHQFKPDARELIEKDMAALAASRPTAINLFWALDRMRDLLESGELDPDRFSELAISIHEQDIADNRRMGELGAAFLPSNTSVLTHCNAGALATGGYGTALGVIRAAHAQGKIKRVFADETRPWLQGSRLTAWEMVAENIPVSLVADGAAAQLLKTGQVSWVIVGSDRIAANGDVANKIGTYSAAIAARYHGVKFMVVAPTSTIDMNVATGADIPIETREAAELLGCAGHPMAAAGAEAWNPVFDVTPAELVDVIVTERGVVEQPTVAKMQALMNG